MKLTRGLLSLVLSISLSLFTFIAVPTQAVSAQDSSVALQRGYRTGYSDGYMAGYRDIIDGLAKDYSKHNEYSKADRAFNKDYGTVEDYRDGYQQGFEAGYDTGFEKRSFEASVPASLQIRGTAPAAGVQASGSESRAAAGGDSTAGSYSTTDVSQLVSFKPESDAVIIIPRDTELIVEVLDELSTEHNKEGDKFNARVVSPTEIAGAIIEGRISKISKPGRIKKRSEMLLSFDRIVLTESRWANFNAVLTEVMPVRGDNVKRVDPEGTAVGKSTVKDDGIKVGGATGAGAVIGAVAGGPVGAAVGAGVGAAFGVGAVIIERGKNINLNPNQQLRIRTAYETQIR
jgi:hypothetical protein